MFEEICLVCGKHLTDDGRAYCSDDCQHTDLSSPSISSSSSALSSPSMGYAPGGDVPPLMPSALGSALKVYENRSRYRVSPSSASSNSWSIVTDDDEDNASHTYCGSDYTYLDTPDPMYRPGFKSPILYSANPSLSYARRPSGTNNHTTVPHPRQRQSSNSSSRHLRGFPRSAPISSITLSNDDEIYSDLGFSSGDTDEADIRSENVWDMEEKPKYSEATKSKRTRNRASLPACFSLLRMNSLTNDIRSSPVSSSSEITVARSSPATPKLPFRDALSEFYNTSSAALMSVHTTPRGRRREPNESRSSRRSGHSSPSHSRSRSRRLPTARSPQLTQQGNVVEEPFDWVAAADLPRRGREAIRRNSSPPPKMIITGVEDSGHPFGAARRKHDINRSKSRSVSRPKTRGRVRAEELYNNGLSGDVPGLGYGRSGLLDRDRGVIARVPL